MLKEIQTKYLEFLKVYYKCLVNIHLYYYFYNILWFLQLMVLICFIFNLIIGYKLFIITFITVCLIHLSYTFYEVLNDYIFNPFLKRVFSIIILLISCKMII